MKEHPQQNVSSEGAAAAPVPRPAAPTSLATLLASHILHDGELVLLILKPSIWAIVLTSLRFIAVVSILLMGMRLYDARLPGSHRGYTELGVSLIAMRLMWAALQWMSRLYVLTDLRILSLSGVFSIDIFDCPLRKVARTRIIHTVRERLVRLGTIEIVPQDDCNPFGYWLMIGRPREVQRQIIAAITRARQGGMPTG